MSKPDAKWEAYKARVPGLAELMQPEAPALEDSDVDYQHLAGSLPDDVASELHAHQSPDLESQWPRLVEHHWCLCEMPEGDFPRVRLYSSVQGLVDAIAQREGQETAVWALYGVPLPLTQSVNTRDNQKARYLRLPNQMAALVSRGDAFRFVEQDQLPENLENEEEGWLGDPAYRASQQFYSPGYAEESGPFVPEIEPMDDEDEDQQD